jgi:hypothetical protein
MNDDERSSKIVTTKGERIFIIVLSICGLALVALYLMFTFFVTTP